MKLGTLRLIASVVVMITLSGPAFGAAGLPTRARPTAAATQPAPTAPATRPTPATPEQTQSYAQREQQSPGLQDFRGGASIYIGGSVLVIVLLIVLILVLV
jgi:hypothetical protein